MSAAATAVTKLLAEQRKRCLATLYSAAENSPWWGRLSDTQQQHFRDQMKSAVGVFYDFTRDVVKVTEEEHGGVRNDVVLDAIRSMHSEQRALAQAIVKEKS